jgi:hypothetical protein
MVRRILTVSAVVVAAMTPWAPVGAQGVSAPGRAAADSIPREYQPPANMCRIWLEGVPAAQQPAPTECSVAVRNKPPNGRVVYGPTKAGGSPRGTPDVPVRRFDGTSTGAPVPVRLPGRPDVRDNGRPL